jgi:hypothetical protein
MSAALPDHLALMSSGAATLDLTPVAQMGGSTLQLRHFAEDTTRAELDDGTDADGAVMPSWLDVAVITRRRRSRAVNSAVMDALGRGPAAVNDEIGRQGAYYWAKEIETALVNVITGVFDPSSGVLRTTHLHDIGVSAQTPVKASYGGLVDASARLGDNMDDFIALCVHSKHWADLKKENAQKIDYQPMRDEAGMPIMDETGRPVRPLRFYDGKLVIVWDQIASTGSGSFKKYTSILVRRGALGIGFQKDVNTRVYYNGSKNQDWIIQPAAFASHLHGVKWVGTAASPAGPTNAELATATNWTKVATNNKEIGLVAFVANAS